MNQNQYTTGNFQSPYGQTETYPNQDGNYGQMRFAPIESEATAYELKKQRQKLKKLRHETEELRRKTEMIRHEMEMMYQEQEEIARCVKYFLMRLSASEPGIFGTDLIAMQLGLPPSGHKKWDNTIFDHTKRSR